MSEYWKDRRVMVTGGAGFLGSAVVRRLKEEGATEVFVPKVLDTSRAREAFGFTAVTDFEAGLRATIESYERTRTGR